MPRSGTANGARIPIRTHTRRGHLAISATVARGTTRCLTSHGPPSHTAEQVCDLLWHLNLIDASGQRYSFGDRYTHRNAAKDFVAALASVLRDRINVAARASRVLGLMLDESTDQSGKKVLLLYLRFCQAGRFVTS